MKGVFIVLVALLVFVSGCVDNNGSRTEIEDIDKDMPENDSKKEDLQNSDENKLATFLSYENAQDFGEGSKFDLAVSYSEDKARVVIDSQDSYYSNYNEGDQFVLHKDNLTIYSMDNPDETIDSPINFIFPLQFYNMVFNNNRGVGPAKDYETILKRGKYQFDSVTVYLENVTYNGEKAYAFSFTGSTSEWIIQNEFPYHLLEMKAREDGKRQRWLVTEEFGEK